MAKTPRPYQQEFIDAAIQRNMLNMDDLGLGKTFMAIQVGLSLWEHRRKPCLAITRKGLKNQWEAEILDAIPRAYVCQPTTDQDFKDLAAVGGECAEDRPCWFIVHFAQLYKYVQYLRKVIWLVGVVDEAHAIKNRKARISEDIKKLLIARKIALTATPIDKHPGEFWSIINWLYPTTFQSYRRFRENYVIEEPDFLGYLHVKPGIKNPEALWRQLRPFTFHRTKEQVADQLPERETQIVRLEMGGYQASTYNKIDDSKDLLVPIDSPEPLLIANGLAKIAKLQKASTDPRLLGVRSLQSSKEEWLDDFFEDNPDESVLVFTTFRDTAIRWAQKYKAYALVGGAEPWKSPPSRIVATIDAGHAGYDLPHIRTTIYADVHHSGIKMAQADGRIHRLSSTYPKQYWIYLINQGTIDEDLYISFKEKWSLRQLVRKALYREVPNAHAEAS